MTSSPIARALWPALVFFLANTLPALGVPAPGPDLGPTTPFGSVAYDPLGPTPNPNQWPIWDQPVQCQEDASPSLIYADDPETWSTQANSWGTNNNLLLEEGTFSGSGILFYYFDNRLGTTARLYIGAIGQAQATTFKFAAGDSNVNDAGNLPAAGAQASRKFLKPYMAGGGFSPASAPAPAQNELPTPFITIAVSNKHLITGEVEVKALSANTTFFVYADDCTTACPGISNVAPDDGSGRRGLFANAHFTITHNFTGSISNSSGGISWADIGGGPPGSVTCVAPLMGTDPIDGNVSRTLAGDYGVPIVISGTPYQQYEQFWYLNPRGNVPYATALWVNDFTDPLTLNPVAAGAYYMPTTAPSASPQPTTVPDTNHAVTIGLDGATDTRTIVYIPSGGDAWPVRFYYIIPGGLRAKQGGP